MKKNNSPEKSMENKAVIQILATSDLHGKFYPWDYALNRESTCGSMAQLSTAISAFRNEGTLLVDAGDTIQDNFADVFFEMEDEIHPMVQAINALNYDIWTPGNHDYNYGMDIVRKTVRDVNAKVLTGNVFDEANRPVADGFTIVEKNGIRIAVIGMVTPNIKRWDAVNLAECTVTDPLAETRRIIESIQGQYDVLVGVFHMGINNEYGVSNSGVTDICNACPEFDVVVSSHEHALIPHKIINGVLVVQNKAGAETMAAISIDLTRGKNSWKVVNKSSESIEVGGYKADTRILQLLELSDSFARNKAEEVIGTLEGTPLVPPNEIEAIPIAFLQDTPLINLINAVQMYYTSAPISASSLCSMDANMFPGNIRKCDMALIYKYTNTLFKIHMTGAQLKKYMEWCARFYNMFELGDLTVSFNPSVPTFNYDFFDGVNYRINISQPHDHRIEGLSWPDGTPVRDEDEFDVAVNNYRANSQLLVPGEIYEADDMPTLVEMDVRGDLGGIRELIGDYIVNAKKGTISPDNNVNWELIGYKWDDSLHKKVVELCKSGGITIIASDNGRTPNVRSIKESDIRE